MDTVQQTTDTLETTRLIAADKVEGTPVESTNGDSLGHVHDIMIDKISGQVGYAVLKYGSFGRQALRPALGFAEIRHQAQCLCDRHSGRKAEGCAELRR